MLRLKDILFSIIINFIFVWGICYCVNDYLKKVNVLIIIIDDLRHLADDNVHLRNVELLAGAGINFKNAFAQQALCAPSRNSILTGRRPDSLHLYDFYSYWRHTVGNFTTLPQLFKEQGYDTYSIGKVFHPGISSNYTDDYPYSWTKKPFHPSTEKYKDASVCPDLTSKKLKKNLICPVDVWEQPKHTLPDRQSLKRGIKFLNRANKSPKPFFLAIGFHKPHIPLKFPIEYLDKYPIDKIQPPNMPKRPEMMPIVAWHPWTDIRARDDIRRLNLTFPFDIMPPEWSQKIRQSYYSASSYVDDLIGTLVNYVNLKNTVVVLTSDHGWSLGENDLWAKYSNIDVAVKVPLIIHIPNIGHKQIETPVELIDIFPTLVDITGIKSDVPKCDKLKINMCFEGKSLLPLILNERVKQFDSKGDEYVALSQYPRPSVYPKKNSDKPRLKDIKIMGYSLRTKRFRYTEWIGFNNTHFIRNWNKIYGIELYDHSFDKYESKNLYQIHAYKDIVKHFSKLLRTKLKTV